MGIQGTVILGKPRSRDYDASTMDANQIVTDGSKQSPGSQDAFEIECVDLLCRLESKLAQLSRIKHDGPNLDTLDVAKLILVEIIDFGEPQLSDEEFGQIAPRISEVYERTKGLEEKVQQTPWTVVSRLWGKQKACEFEVTSAYEELNKDYALLIAEFFVLCVSRFETSPPEKKSFLEGVDAFVSELGRHW